MSVGYLDTKFNTPDGYITSQLFPGYSSIAKSVVVDSAGNTIVCGYATDSYQFYMFLAKYDTNGNIVTEFGEDGYVLRQFIGGFDTLGMSLQLDNSDNIYVTGITSDGKVNYMFLAKYNKYGYIVTTFGKDGYVLKQFVDGIDTVGSFLNIDTNGDILITGFMETTQGRFMLLAKYNTEGNIVSTFGTNGYILEQFFDGYDTLGLYVVTDSGNNVYVTGYTDDGTANNVFIVKYNSNGTPSNNFGSNGCVIQNVVYGVNSVSFSLTIDNSGNIIITGITSDGVKGYLFLAKYDMFGNVLNGFGRGGHVVTDVLAGSFLANGNTVLVDNVNNILVTGYMIGPDGGGYMFLGKFDSNGNLIQQFGTNGFITTQFYSGSKSCGGGMVLDKNNNVIVVGIACNGTSKITFECNDFNRNDNNNNLFIARYKNINYEPICVPGDTPILTDQGLIAINKIDTSLHTISRKKIVAITNCITPEKVLVCFEPNSISINCPTKRTLMTTGHEILYKGKLIQAKHFIGKFNGVYTVPYNGKDILYNVLQEKHGLMSVNNIILETLNPTNKIARGILNSTLQ